MEDITDAVKTLLKICEDLEKKNLGEYHDLYLKSDTLLLDNVWKTSEKCV